MIGKIGSQFRSNFRLAGFLLALAASAPCPAASADAPRAELVGTIVSIRGGILVVRPWLRPKMTRVSFDDKTVILSFERTSMSYLKPGVRVSMRGFYSSKQGYHPRFVEATEKPSGYLAQKSHGIQVDKDPGWANAVGTLKSVQPFVFTDDYGKEYSAQLDHMRGVWRTFVADKSGLLIGVRINVQGTLAPDGVLKATSITPDQNFSQDGTMFGQVIGVKGNHLLVRPRYTSDTMEVLLDPSCAPLKQINLDPDNIKVGDQVTFWGQQHNHSWDEPRSTDMLAIALLLGTHRYPAAQGDNGGVFLTGKIASLDPPQLALPNGTVINVIVPAQMPTARLEPVRLSDVTTGSQAMIVLTRASDGRFHCTHLILDASPWVGYGG